MDDRAREILCDERLIAVRERHMQRLDALFAGEKLDHAFVLWGVGWPSDLDPDKDPRSWVAESLKPLADAADQGRDPRTFRPLCLEAWHHGVHFVDKLLGARVYRSAESKQEAGSWWADYLASPVGTLRRPDLANHPSWLKAQALAAAIASSGVTVPLFGTQVLSSPLNIALNLYGQEILAALIGDPDAARRDLRVIADTILDLHRFFRAAFPPRQFQPVVVNGRCQPRGFGQICGCSTQLVSPGQYRDLVAPLDSEVLSLYPNGGMIHLCGRHSQHIPAWRGMNCVRAVQLNDRAAEDFELYFRGLRDDQVIYMNPTPTATVERALKFSGGRRLVIVADVKEPPKLPA